MQTWDDALKEAEDLKLINTVEATAAKALPPGFPLHTTTEMDTGNFANAGFAPGKPSPPQMRSHHAKVLRPEQVPSIVCSRAQSLTRFREKIGYIRD
jgi:hypothetical protein